jgi:hypothetical protein
MRASTSSPARGKRHDHGDRSRRIGLRPRHARDGQQRRRASGQMKMAFRLESEKTPLLSFLCLSLTRGPIPRS